MPSREWEIGLIRRRKLAISGNWLVGGLCQVNQTLALGTCPYLTCAHVLGRTAEVCRPVRYLMSLGLLRDGSSSKLGCFWQRAITAVSVSGTSTLPKTLSKHVSVNSFCRIAAHSFLRPFWESLPMPLVILTAVARIPSTIGFEIERRLKRVAIAVLTSACSFAADSSMTSGNNPD
jgi:hypothetical protein